MRNWITWDIFLDENGDYQWCPDSVFYPENYCPHPLGPQEYVHPSEVPF